MTINQHNLNTIVSATEKYNKQLIIVTKNRSPQDLDFLLKSGFRKFGENKVQEGAFKFQIDIRQRFENIELHLIGPLQSNKTEKALETFDVIQTIDRKKIIDEICKIIIKPKKFLTKGYFIQVNIGEEQQKSGVTKNELHNLYKYALEKKLNIIGLMCIPPKIGSSSIYFREMIALRDNLNSKLKLSMGMSDDYKEALSYGTDIIRVGSSIFQ